MSLRFFDRTADLVGQLNGNGQKVMLQIDTTGTVLATPLVPTQPAQCRFPGLAISSGKISIHFFQIKYTEATLSNSTGKLLWFGITKMLIAV